MLLAQIFGTLMNVTTRLLEVEGNRGNGLHPFQILFARMGITFLLASGYMWYKKTPHFPFGLPEVRWLLVARGFGGFFGVFGMYYSLLYLPLADSTVITFLAPGLACWACAILINEPFTRIEQIAGLVSLVGVVLIARPTTFFAAFGGTDSPPATGNSDAVPTTNTTAPAVGGPDAASYEDVTPTQRLMAVSIGLVGVVGSAVAFTTIRWIGKRAHPLISVNYFAAWCTLVSVIMQSALPDVGFLLPVDLKEWGYLFFLGTCGFIMVCHPKCSEEARMSTKLLFTAIPSGRWARVRKVLTSDQHHLHADALRPGLRQAHLQPHPRPLVHRRIDTHPRLRNVRCVTRRRDCREQGSDGREPPARRRREPAGSYEWRSRRAYGRRPRAGTGRWSPAESIAR